MFSAHINCSEQLLSERRAFFPSIPYDIATQNNVKYRQGFFINKISVTYVKEEESNTNDLSPRDCYYVNSSDTKDTDIFITTSKNVRLAPNIS